MGRIRSLLSIGVALAGLAGLLAGLSAGPAAADRQHGLAILGSLKYPAGFKHFDYVDPNAPRDGEIVLWFPGSYDNLNPFLLKGLAAAGSNPFLAGGSQIVHATLMVKAQDEPDSYYGLIAESVELPDDRAWIAFHLRPEAVFHDGAAITAADVVFSFDTLKADGHPIFRILYRDVIEAKALGPRSVRFAFRAGAETRDLPGYLAGLPVISSTYYASHEFNKTTLDPPLGSGPYRIVKVDPGRSITYERIANHWADGLGVQSGRYNFAKIRWDYYRDREIALEALFAGQIDFREDFTSRDWATKYDGVNGVKDGRLKREVLADASPSGTQGFFFNIRRPKFQDRRVREALGLAFDFEWTNKNLFYSLYQRTHSIFQNSDLEAAGAPSAAELALLNPFRGQLPNEVYGPAYVPPKTDGSGRLRAELRRARKLLQQAGWTIQDGVLKDAAGTAFEIEFIERSRAFERIIAPYIKNLRTLGIAARFRLLETAQYQNRRNSFDYDVMTSRFSSPLTPGVSLRNTWASKAADVPGTQNLAGVQDPVVDALIEKVVEARDREALTAATRALDRVVMWQHYLVPQWFKAAHTIAYWDMFGRPARKPPYDLGFLDTWWVDAAKAAGLKKGG